MIKVLLKKDLWVNGSLNIAKFRDSLLEEQRGMCAILGEPVDKPCLDHDHFDGKCRGVIGSNINMFEGQIQKQWSKHMEGKTSLTMTEALRRIADYLEKDNSSMPLHGEIVSSLKKSLNRWTKETIVRNALNNFNMVVDINLEKKDIIELYINKFVERLEDNYLYERK